MRLIVYNIRYGAGIGRRFHLPVPYIGYLKPTNGHFGKIVEFIKSVNPDIVGLIEVDFGSYRVEKFNQAETIARELNHQVVCKSKYAEASMARKVPVLNKQGNAILTGLPIVARRYHFFNEGVKRLVIEVELQEVIVFLVHLSLKFRHRQYQLNDLHALIAGSDKPVIVAGDFTARKFAPPVFRSPRSSSPITPHWFGISRSIARRQRGLFWDIPPRSSGLPTSRRYSTLQFRCISKKFFRPISALSTRLKSSTYLSML